MLQFRQQRDQMHVSNAQAFGKVLNRLQRFEDNVLKTEILNGGLDGRMLVSTTNEQEADIRPVLETFRRCQHGAELMRPPEVSRITDDELILQSPRLAQAVVPGETG